mgnify:CR=1 FL=1
MARGRRRASPLARTAHARSVSFNPYHHLSFKPDHRAHRAPARLPMLPARPASGPFAEPDAGTPRRKPFRAPAPVLRHALAASGYASHPHRDPDECPQIIRSAHCLPDPRPSSRSSASPYPVLSCPNPERERQRTAGSGRRLPHHQNTASSGKPAARELILPQERCFLSRTIPILSNKRPNVNAARARCEQPPRRPSQPFDFQSLFRTSSAPGCRAMLILSF